MTLARGTVLGCLDALPVGGLFGGAAFVAAQTGDVGLPAVPLAGIIGLAILLVLATVSLNRYRADGTRFAVTRNAIDAAFFWF